ncbi:MAG: c-type cytochrome [Halorhodospira sp.]
MVQEPRSIRLRVAVIGVLGAGSLLLASPLVLAEEERFTRGEMIANSCFACHGPSGQGAESMPPLADWDEEELVDTMEDFREGRGDLTVMDRHATGYTDEQIREVAAYIAEMD